MACGNFLSIPARGSPDIKMGVMIVFHSFSVIVVEAIGYSIVFIIVAVRANQASFLLR
jgi:hypothetical protein